MSLTDLKRQSRFPQHLAADERPQENDVIFLEANLATLGFFSAWSPYLNALAQKKVSIVRRADGKRVTRRLLILPSRTLGLPTVADQDRYLALLYLVQKNRRFGAPLKNPITFSALELIEVLDQTDSGKNYRDIERWIRRMTSTTIVSSQAVFCASSASWISSGVHVFDRFVSQGEHSDHGSATQEHAVYLSDWHLGNLNQGHTVRLGWNRYRSLKNQLSRLLVVPLQVWLYAGRKRGFFEKSYADLAQFLGLRQQSFRSRIHRQLQPALVELCEKGHLADWRLTEDREGELKVRFQAPIQPAAPNEKTSSVLPYLVRQLTERAIPEDQATEIAGDAEDPNEILSRLAYTDQVVRKGGIENPVGFRIAYLRERRPVPADHTPAFAQKPERSGQGPILAEAPETEGPESVANPRPAHRSGRRQSKPSADNGERDELHEEICNRVISKIGREAFRRRVEERAAAYLRRLGEGREVLARRMAESTVCDQVEEDTSPVSNHQPGGGPA